MRSKRRLVTASMSAPSSYRRPERSRQLTWLVAILVISNVGLGFFSFYLLRTMDERYSALIGQSVPVLNDLQTLTARSVDVMRATGPTLLEAPAARHAELLQAGAKHVQVDRTLRSALLTAAWPALGQGKEGLAQAGDAFNAQAQELFRLVSAGEMVAARQFRDAMLRLSFERYMETITETADALKAESLRLNNDYSAKTGSMSRIVLGLSGWPVIAAGGLLLLTGILVLGLMFLFRGREMTEGP